MSVVTKVVCQPMVIAETGERFIDFAPYVPAVLENGAALFSARATDGRWNVFRFDGGIVTTIMTESIEACSHPAGGGVVLAVYALQKDGDRVVFVGRDGEFTSIAHAGPLGPTVNSAGIVAFRTELPDQTQQICTFDRKVNICADSKQFAAFHGLPLVMRDGAVVFRADLHDGQQGIFRSDASRTTPIVLTGERFTSLGNFPSSIEASIAFCATSTNGESNAYIARDSEIVPLLHDTTDFASIRGVLVDASARITFYATPASGEQSGRLAVFQSDCSEVHRIVGIGDAIDESTVEDFALNPVSINRAGRVAIRVKLENGKQKILVFDPVKQN